MTRIKNPGIPVAEPAKSRNSLLNFINRYGGGRTIYRHGSGATTKGYVYYLKPDESWDLTNATTNLSGSDQVVAMAMGPTPAYGMLLKGVTSYSTAVDGYSVGKALYLSTTDGRLTTTAPTGSGEVVRIGGHCLNVEPFAAYVYFNPEPGWLELV